MADPISVLIVDDHLLFRECLATVLQDDPRYSITAAVAEPASVFALLKTEQPEILLVDVLLPDGGALDVARRVSAEFPEVKVLVLGLEGSEAEVLRCIEAGATGYVLKEASLGDLKQSIATVMQGGAPCSPRIAYRVFSRLAELSDRHWTASDDAGKADLSLREVEILELVSRDFSNKEIAGRLHLSVSTVKNHIHRILGKLRVSDRRTAVKHARDRRLIA